MKKPTAEVGLGPTFLQIMINGGKLYGQMLLNIIRPTLENTSRGM